MARDLKISKIVLVLAQAEWTIRIGLNPSESSYSQPLWFHETNSKHEWKALHRSNPSVIAIQDRPHQLGLSIEHPSPGFVREKLPMSITVTNEDSRTLDVVAEILLQPAENDTTNFILYGDTTSTGLIKDVSFGSVAPHATESRVVYLRMTGGPGPRMVDFSIQSTVSGSDPNKQHHNEILEAATVEGVQPFSSDSHVSYSQPRLDPPGLLSIDRLVDPRGDVCAEASIITTIGVEATCDIFVERIEFVASEDSQAHLQTSSLDFLEADFPSTWQPEDEYAIATHFLINSQDEEESERRAPFSPGRLIVTWRRASSKDEETFSTDIHLPSLQPPDFGLSAIVEPPTSVQLHKHFGLTVKIRNSYSQRASELAFSLEPVEGFAVSGLRSGVLPLLLPGSTQDLVFNLVPLQLGLVRLPIFRFILRNPVAEQTSEGEPRRSTSSDANAVGNLKMEAVDSRWDDRLEGGVKMYHVEANGDIVADSGQMAVLVVP